MNSDYLKNNLVENFKKTTELFESRRSPVNNFHRIVDSLFSRRDLIVVLRSRSTLCPRNNPGHIGFHFPIPRLVSHLVTNCPFKGRQDCD